MEVVYLRNLTLERKERSQGTRKSVVVVVVVVVVILMAVVLILVMVVVIVDFKSSHMFRQLSLPLPIVYSGCFSCIFFF